MLKGRNAWSCARYPARRCDQCPGGHALARACRIIPIRITPGFGLSHDIAAGTEWIEVLGYFIVWLAFFAIVGFLAAARILLHEVGARSPGVSRSARDGTAYDPGPRRCMSHAIVGTVSKRTRPSLKS